MTGSAAAAHAVVRAYEPADRDALYDVCLRTGDAGGDASALTADPTLVGDIYVGPYLELAPAFALVADDGHRAAGYALAALDTAEFEARCDERWWAAARARHPLPARPRAYDAEQYAVLADPSAIRHPALPGFPSHLHIDLLEHLRGGGLGRAMMTELFGMLRAAGSPGVHLGVDVRNEGAQRFYDRLGFTRLVDDIEDVRYLGLSLQ